MALERGNDPTALVVENDDDTRTMLAEMLRHAGYDVRTAPDGASGMSEFWRTVSDGRPARLVTMDVAMPGMDGLATAERIRRAEREQGLPRAFIVGLTGYGEYLLSGEAVRRADFDVLETKPADPAKLVTIFKEVKRGEC
jgi:CheY-like chemotaxis protein